MPNNMYIQGRYFEHLVFNWLSREGYITCRAAGSHGLFDVIAIPTLVPTNLGWCPDNVVLCIQIKSVSDKSFNDDLWIDSFIYRSQELKLFRETCLAFHMYWKILMIFNRDRKKDLPYIYYHDFITGKYSRLDLEQLDIKE